MKSIHSNPPKRHHPPHLYLDDTVYFLTSHLHKTGARLETTTQKQDLLNWIRERLSTEQYQLYAWVILPDHYHILFQSASGKALPDIMQRIHGGFSFHLNKSEGTPGRRVFQNYWDRCIRNQRDSYTHFNYIHHNPVKHGLTRQMSDYEFSSYLFWRGRKGEEWLASCFESYPIIDFSIDGDENEILKD